MLRLYSIGFSPFYLAQKRKFLSPGEVLVRTSHKKTKENYSVRRSIRFFCLLCSFEISDNREQSTLWNSLDCHWFLLFVCLDYSVNISNRMIVCVIDFSCFPRKFSGLDRWYRQKEISKQCNELLYHEFGIVRLSFLIDLGSIHNLPGGENKLVFRWNYLQILHLPCTCYSINLIFHFLWI